MSRIFVTGGAGFIGSHFSNTVLSAVDTTEVTVFDNFSSGKETFLKTSMFGSRIRIIDGDIKDLDKLVEGMRGCTSVAHFAANPDISMAVTSPDIDFWEGTFLTQNVLEAMRLTGAQFLIYSSGSGVYGEKNTAFDEQFGPCIPVSTYGASKLASEALIAAYSHMFGLRARVFRFANVVGPNQTHGVGFDFIRRLRADPQKLEVLGDGTQTKSYIHVQDVISAISLVTEKALEPDALPFDVFNVASSDRISVREIAIMAIELMSPSARLVFGKGARGWLGDVPQIELDSGKIRNLGWRERMNSRTALLESMTSMKENLESGI